MVSDFVLGSYVPSSKPKTKSDTWHYGNQLSPASGFGFRCILLLGPNIGTPSLVYREERNNTQHARTDPAWQALAAVVG